MNEFFNSLAGAAGKYFDYRTAALTNGRTPGPEQYANQIGTKPLPAQVSSQAQPAAGPTGLEALKPYAMIALGIIGAVALVRTLSK